MKWIKSKVPEALTIPVQPDRLKRGSLTGEGKAKTTECCVTIMMWDLSYSNEDVDHNCHLFTKAFHKGKKNLSTSKLIGNLFDQKIKNKIKHVQHTAQNSKTIGTKAASNNVINVCQERFVKQTALPPQLVSIHRRSMSKLLANSLFTAWPVIIEECSLHYLQAYV